MEVALFVAADFANQTESGKLNILGVFTAIYAKKFPVRHRRLFLIIKLIAGLGENETEHDLRILFVDADGHELQDMPGKLMIEHPKGGKQATAEIILEVGALLLPKPGTYEFRLILNKDIKGILPIEAIQLPSTEE